MKKIISVVVILGLVVTGSIIGFKEYKEIQQEREQETLDFMVENYNELIDLGDEYNRVSDEYYWSYEIIDCYDEIADDIGDIIKELKQYEIQSFKNNEEYNKMLTLLIEGAEVFEKGVISAGDYESTIDRDDRINRDKSIREWNRKADDIVEFLDNKMLLNESKEI
jgi:hypothetical protein